MTTESMGSILQQRLLREERGKSERLFALLVELKTGIDNLEGLGVAMRGRAGSNLRETTTPSRQAL